MRVGNVRPPNTAVLQSSQASASAQDFGAGIASALGGLGSTLQQAGVDEARLREQMAERERQKKRQQKNVEFIRLQGEATRMVQEQRREAPAGADGFTNQIHESVRERFEPFLESIEDEDMRQRFAAQTEQFTQNAATAAFQFEFEESNRFFVEQVQEEVGEAQKRLRESPDLLQQELETFTTLIGDSALTAEQKEETLGATLQALQASEFQTQLELAQQQLRPVRETDGSDVVAPGVPSVYRALLNTVAGTESPDYATLNGGGKITDYSDHPRRRGPGGESTAAGRYQFIESTWDFVVRSMKAEGYEFGNEEFSPVNQDRAAIWYAQHRYRQGAIQRGFPPEMQRLTAVLQSGDRQALGLVREIFAGQGTGEDAVGVVWEGLQNLSDDAFANKVLGGARRGGTGQSPAPDIWDDEKYDAIDFNTRLELENAAMQSVEETRRRIAEARQREEQALYDQLRRSAEDGDQGISMQIDQALAQDLITDNKMREDLRKRSAEDRQLVETAQDTQRRMNAGASFLPDEGEKFDALYRKSGLLEGLMNGDQMAARGLVEDFRQSEVVAPTAVEALMQQTRSVNPDQQAYGFATLAGMYDANPSAFSAGVSDEVARRAMWFETSVRNGVSPEQVVKRFNDLNAAGTEQIRTEMRTRADEELEDFAADDVLNSVTGFWERTLPEAMTGMPSPDLPAQARDNMLFQQDYRTLFRENYILTGGDAGQAHELTGGTMSRRWNVDPLSGSLMKYSPMALGSQVPQVEGGYEWIEEVVRTETGLGVDEPAALIMDPRTEREVLSGQPPSYLVQTQGPDGMPSLVMDENGGFQRVTIAPSESILQRVEINAQITNLEEQARRIIERESDVPMPPNATNPFRLLMELSNSMTEMTFSPETQSELNRIERRIENLKLDRSPQGDEIRSRPMPGGPNPMDRSR